MCGRACETEGRRAFDKNSIRITHTPQAHDTAVNKQQESSQHNLHPAPQVESSLHTTLHIKSTQLKSYKSPIHPQMSQKLLAACSRTARFRRRPHPVKQRQRGDAKRREPAKITIAISLFHPSRIVASRSSEASAAHTDTDTKAAAAAAPCEKCRILPLLLSFAFDGVFPLIVVARYPCSNPCCAHQNIKAGHAKEVQCTR